MIMWLFYIFIFAFECNTSFALGNNRSLGTLITIMHNLFCANTFLSLATISDFDDMNEEE